MSQLGNGLYDAKHNEDALTVREAEYSMERRLGASEECILLSQSNLASTYGALGRREEALRTIREVYSGWLKLEGEDDVRTIMSANSYATSLLGLRRFEEAKTLLRKSIPVARRVLGESNEPMLRARWICAWALYEDPTATLDDLREAVSTLEDAERTTRRVFGGAHPLAVNLERDLRNARAILSVREDAPRLVAIFAAVALVAAAAYLVM